MNRKINAILRHKANLLDHGSGIIGGRFKKGHKLSPEMIKKMQEAKLLKKFQREAYGTGIVGGVYVGGAVKGRPMTQAEKDKRNATRLQNKLIKEEESKLLSKAIFPDDPNEFLRRLEEYKKIKMNKANKNKLEFQNFFSKYGHIPEINTEKKAKTMFKKLLKAEKLGIIPINSFVR